MAGEESRGLLGGGVNKFIISHLLNFFLVPCKTSWNDRKKEDYSKAWTLNALEV